MSTLRDILAANNLPESIANKLVNGEAIRDLAQALWLRTEKLVEDESASIYLKLDVLNQLIELIENGDISVTYLNELTTIITDITNDITNIEGNITNIEGDITTINGNLDDLRTDLTAVEGRLDVIEGPDTQAGSIRKAAKDTLDDSKQYTDDRIEALIGGAPDILDTLKKLADAITDDSTGSIFDLISDSITDKADIEWVTNQLLLKLDKTTWENWLLTYEAYQTSQASDLGDIEDRLDVIEGDNTVVGSIRKAALDALTAANTYTDEEIAKLEATIDGFIGDNTTDLGQLVARLNVLEGDDTTVGSVAKAQKDAEDVADQLSTIALNTANTYTDTRLGSLTAVMTDTEAQLHVNGTRVTGFPLMDEDDILAIIASLD